MPVNLALWQARFAEYLHLRRYARRTVEEHVRELRHFFSYLEAAGAAAPADITRALIEGWRAQLAERRHRGRVLSPSTQAHRLACIKLFTHFLAREQFIALDPAADVEGPRVRPAAPRAILSESEVERVLDAADGPEPIDVRDRAILEVLYGTAIRRHGKDSCKKHTDLRRGAWLRAS